jgi:hypothetical protein
MRGFKDLDMVEYLGSGMPRILKAYSREAYVLFSRFIRIVFPVDPAALELEKEVAQPDAGLGMMSEKASEKILSKAGNQTGRNHTFRHTFANFPRIRDRL